MRDRLGGPVDGKNMPVADPSRDCARHRTGPASDLEHAQPRPQRQRVHDHQQPRGLLADVAPHVRLLAVEVHAVARVHHECVRADDEFNRPVQQVQDLFITVRCRKLAVELGFEKMVLKNNTLRCFFINRPDSPYFESELFKNILAYLQTGTNKARLKQTGRLFLLIVEPANNMQDTYDFLSRMHAEVFQKEKNPVPVG